MKTFNLAVIDDGTIVITDSETGKSVNFDSLSTTGSRILEILEMAEML